ncbi:MAG TPA: OB-fold nucleic acid binding domain-containing protein, partial [Roseimicrobium sp.]|nr:OB-fold nucleic acid binding domain-containing protein [Roseimicrobium sp.]
KELLGFYVTGHPLSPYAPILEKYVIANSVQMAALPARGMTRTAGMIAGIQQGFSKKSNKPYAMITLEDLEGSFQILAMNENYDKYREHFVVNKALMIIGEVNNGEDRPKVFPTEIMPLEDAPRKFTKQVHFRLNTAHLDPEKIQQAFDLAQAHPGRCPLFLCMKYPAGQMVFIEAHERYRVMPSLELERAVNSLFGEDTYYAKVDTTVPERVKPRWEKKSQDNGGDE